MAQPEDHHCGPKAAPEALLRDNKIIDIGSRIRSSSLVCKLSMSAATTSFFPTRLQTLISVFSFFTFSQAVTINAPSTVPFGASSIVDHAFPGLAIEAIGFPAYSGDASAPNDFSANLISVIQSKLGMNMIIRVGGTSGDFETFKSSQTDDAALSPNPPDPRGAVSNWTFGPSFYEGFANFPGANFTWQDPVNVKGPHLS